VPPGPPPPSSCDIFGIDLQRQTKNRNTPSTIKNSSSSGDIFSRSSGSGDESIEYYAIENNRAINYVRGGILWDILDASASR